MFWRNSCFIHLHDKESAPDHHTILMGKRVDNDPNSRPPKYVGAGKGAAWVSVSVSDDEYHTGQPNWRQAEFLACSVVRTSLGVWTPAPPQQPRTDGCFYGCASKYER